MGIITISTKFSIGEKVVRKVEIVARCNGISSIERYKITSIHVYEDEIKYSLGQSSYIVRADEVVCPDKAKEFALNHWTEKIAYISKLPEDLS